MKEIDDNKFGLAAAIVSAACMLLLGILGNMGIYVGAANAMMNWHMYFSLSFAGIVTGMIEAAIISYVFVYAFAWTYNKLV